MSRYSNEQFLYLTTTGRKTGLPREIEIWFVEREGRLYLLAEHGYKAPWILLLLHNAVDEGRGFEASFILGKRLQSKNAIPFGIECGLVGRARTLQRADSRVRIAIQVHEHAGHYLSVDGVRTILQDSGGDPSSITDLSFGE